MPPLSLADLAANLSPSAALWRAIDPDVVWGLPEMLTALLIDEIRVLRWEFERVNFKGKAPKPDPIPRPGVKPREERATFGGGASALPMDEMAAWLGWAAPMPSPEIDARGRVMPQRDARGRFVSARG